MGRPTKQGLDFFPVDVDMFDDEKLLFVTARFGIKGDGIVMRLLCRIYRSGYCIKYDSDFALLFARSAGDTSLAGLVSEVVNELLKRGFFDEDIFKRFGLLTSVGIQKRYAKICIEAKRKDWQIPPDFDLLRRKPAFTPEETDLTPEFSTQRKVKESKEKKSKGVSADAQPSKRSDQQPLKTGSGAGASPPGSAAPPQSQATVPWNTDAFREAWSVWKAYKKNQFRFTYKGPESEQAALVGLSEKAGGHEDVAIKIIKQSIENGWAGLFELKNSSNGHSKTTGGSHHENQRRELAEHYANLARQGRNNTG